MKIFLGFVLFVAFLAKNVNSFDNDEKEQVGTYTNLKDPFRSQKVNLLWNKARTKLTEKKLKALYTELKVHDKEAMALKKLKAENMDKEGLREAEIRKKFNGIMYAFGLAKAAPDHEGQNQKNSDGIFKDKKLQRLWQKANKAGLEDEELAILKKEFQDHQEKLDQFHILKDLSHKSQDGNLHSNHIHLLDDDDVKLDHNTLDGKAKDLKDDYARLHRLATNTNPTEFIEPKVRGLWKLAQEADFTDEELESLRQELHHYEKRVEKLHQLKAETHLVNDEKKMARKLAKHLDSVDKLHAELASKIAARHSEL